MKKVSIIIPVYNVENYIRSCLDSIVNQTYKNIEVILVDDGSNDLSGKICDEYAQKDTRFKVYHNTNHGVSYSRNYGIDISTGEYIIFIDSDDIISLQYIEEMMKVIVENEVDLVVCNVIDIFLPRGKRKGRHIGILSGNFRIDYVNLINLLRVPVAKMYKATIIHKNRIYFPDNIAYNEDQLFNFLYYRYVKLYKYTNKAEYYYCHKRTGLSQQKNEETFLSSLYKLKQEKIFLKNMEIYKGSMILCDHCISVLNDFCDIEYKSYKKKIKIINEIIDNNYHASNWKRYLILKCMQFKIYFPVYAYYKFKNNVSRMLGK